MEEKVSIVVPVYNMEDYLKKCVDSICRQTYSNLEIILVDDGSTDSSPELCDEYQKRDARIKVIHKKNEGLSCARNDGIDSATGEYLMFADSDDWLEPDMVEYMYTNIKKSGVRLAICGYYTVKGNKKRRHSVKEDRILERRAAMRELTDFSEPGYIPNPAWIQIMERGLMDNIRFPAGRIYEDALTTYKLVEEADRVLVLKEPKYNYYQRKGSIIHGNQERINLARCYTFEVRYCDLRERYPELEDIMLYKYLYTYTKMARDGVSEENMPEFMQRRKFFREKADELYHNPYVKRIEQIEIPLLAQSSGKSSVRLWVLEFIRMSKKIPWKIRRMAGKQF
jgi:glycosyltransferase involved in cell wall biosynthesis